MPYRLIYAARLGLRAALLSAVAAAPVTGWAVAHAQDSEPEAQEPEDTVVVTGQRGVLINSLEEKREADGIVDLLSADQADRFPDANVAEALGRLPGVSFLRDNETGDGQFLSIRGLDSALNSVQFDGLNSATADDDRRVPLDPITAQNVSQIRVTKTPLPSDDSAAIGGVVDIRTRTPLERGDDFYRFNFQGRQYDIAEKVGWGAGFNVNKIINDKFGFNLAGSYRDRFITTYQIDPASAIDSEFVFAPTVNDAEGNPVVFNDSGTFTTASGREVDTDPIGLRNFFGGDDLLPAISNEQLNYTALRQKQETTTFSGAIDWAPDDTFKVTLLGRYNLAETTNTDQTLEFDADFDEFTDDPDPTTGLFLGLYDDPEVSFQGEIEDAEDENSTLQLQAEQFAGQWKLDYGLGYSYAYRNQPQLEIRFVNDFDDLNDVVPGASDDNPASFAPINLSGEFNTPVPGLADAIVYAVDPFCGNVADSGASVCNEIEDFNEELVDERENTRISARFDAAREMEFGPLREVKFGALLQRSEFEALFIDLNGIDDTLSFNEDTGEFGWQPDGGDPNYLLRELGLLNETPLPIASDLGQPLLLFGPDGSPAVSNIVGFNPDGTPILGEASQVAINSIPAFNGDALRRLREEYRADYFADLEDCLARAGGSDPCDADEIPTPVGFENRRGDEDTYVAYIQNSFSFLDDRLEIVGGARIEQYEGRFEAVLVSNGDVTPENLDPDDPTELDDLELSTGETTFISYETEDTQILPRIVGTYRYDDNWVFRAGYTTSIARPSVRLLAQETDANLNIDLVPGASTETATFNDIEEIRINYDSANPDLKPQYAHSFDFGVEYYRDESNAFTMGLFYKRIEDFIFNLDASGGTAPGFAEFDLNNALQQFAFSEEGAAFVEQVGGLDTLIDNAIVVVEQPVNGGVAEVYGIEFGAYHVFDYLPGFLQDFGFFGNLTLLESETDVDIANLSADDAIVQLGLANEGDVLSRDLSLFNSPDVTANASLFYQAYGLEAALSYSFTGQQLEEIEFFGVEEYQQAYERVDLDIEYELPYDNYGQAIVFFEVNDLTDDGGKSTTFEAVGKTDAFAFNDFASFNGREIRFGGRLNF